MEPDNDRFTIRHDWHVEGAMSTAGVYSLDLFGSRATSNLRVGRNLVVGDVDRELAPEDGAGMFNAIGIKAIVCCPLVKDGKLVAMMAVHQGAPRPWTMDEVALIEAVVERCWAHIERVRSSVALQEVVGSAVETSLPLLEAAGHALAVDMPDAPLLLDIDAVRISQVLSNLISNAAKYTPPGGRIAVTVRRAGGEVTLAVRDTGIGIAAESLAMLFEMFTQVARSLDRSNGGLGIGLALVRHLVQLHGGSVGAASPGPGQGSTFTVRLPLGASMDPATAAAGVQADLPAHVPAHVQADAPAGLPAGAARAIRALPGLEGVRLVALTGWGAQDDRRRSREAGFDEHLLKPAVPDEVAALLEQVARR